MSEGTSPQAWKHEIAHVLEKVVEYLKESFDKVSKHIGLTNVHKILNVLDASAIYKHHETTRILIETAVACDICGIDIEDALTWLIGSLLTKWVVFEIQGLNMFMKKYNIDRARAHIERKPLDYPYDFEVYYNGVHYIVEVSRHKSRGEFVKKLRADEEVQRRICAEPNVKFVLVYPSEIVEIPKSEICKNTGV